MFKEELRDDKKSSQRSISDELALNNLHLKTSGSVSCHLPVKDHPLLGIRVWLSTTIATILYSAQHLP